MVAVRTARGEAADRTTKLESALDAAKQVVGRAAARQPTTTTTTSVVNAAAADAGKAGPLLAHLAQLFELASGITGALGQVVHNGLGLAFRVVVGATAGHRCRRAGRATVTDAALGRVQGATANGGLNGVGQGKGCGAARDDDGLVVCRGRVVIFRRRVPAGLAVKRARALVAAQGRGRVVVSRRGLNTGPTVGVNGKLDRRPRLWSVDFGDGGQAGEAVELCFVQLLLLLPLLMVHADR